MPAVFEWLSQAAPAIGMIAVFALILGGLRLLRRGGAERTKGVLMLVLAVVIMGNVLILTM